MEKVTLPPPERHWSAPPCVQVEEREQVTGRRDASADRITRTKHWSGGRQLKNTQKCSMRENISFNTHQAPRQARGNRDHHSQVRQLTSPPPEP